MFLKHVPPCSLLRDDTVDTETAAAISANMALCASELLTDGDLFAETLESSVDF